MLQEMPPTNKGPHAGVSPDDTSMTRAWCGPDVQPAKPKGMAWHAAAAALKRSRPGLCQPLAARAAPAS